MKLCVAGAFVLISVALLSCNLAAAVSHTIQASAQGEGASQTPSGAGTELLGSGEATPSILLTLMAGPASPTESQAPQAGVVLSATQAGLPTGFPIYPGAHGLSGEPGMVLTYTADADVRTTAGFYSTQLKAGGWTSVQSVLGPMTGSCGDSTSCGAVQAATPGPTPTATPAGWLSEAYQLWTKGSTRVSIQFSVNDKGGTEVSILLSKQ
ncbi:MAG: hypothetical protein ABSB61_13545 [Anaerolineales bacterium]